MLLCASDRTPNLVRQVTIAWRAAPSPPPSSNLDLARQFTRGTVEFGGTHHDVINKLPGVRQSLPQCHGGFYNAYASIKVQLQEELMTALREAGPSARLFVTGECAWRAHCVRA